MRWSALLALSAAHITLSSPTKATYRTTIIGKYTFPRFSGRIFHNIARRNAVKERVRRCEASELPIMRDIMSLEDTNSEDLKEVLGRDFMAVSSAEMQPLHAEPPILTVKRLLSPEECEELINSATETGRLQKSPVGASYFKAGGGGGELEERRTSTSLLIDDEVMNKFPKLRQMTNLIHKKVQNILPGNSWGAPGRMPNPGDFVFEHMQVARYEQGQHFLEHEDGFPVDIARSNRFQRRATVLVYLNDVPSGGETRFQKLDVNVKPEKGKALIFFPSTSDGIPDSRTLHSAQDAVDTKWVMQLWVSWGLTSAFNTAVQSLPPYMTSSGEKKVLRVNEEEDKGLDRWKPSVLAREAEMRRRIRAKVNDDVNDVVNKQKGKKKKKDGKTKRKGFG